MIKMNKKPSLKNDRETNGWFWLPKNKLSKYPFPRVINQYRESVAQSLF
jgi:hypothetical protein